MLSITGHTTPGVASVEVDPYVPLSFRALPSPRPEPVIWRTGDLRANLFEVKIDRSSREVFAATLVAFDGDFADLDAGLFSDAEPVAGLPLADWAPPSSSVIDEPGIITLARSSDQVVLFFGDIMRPMKLFSADRARFVVRDDSLVGVGFSDLTPAEIQVIVGFVSANPTNPVAFPSGSS